MKNSYITKSNNYKPAFTLSEILITLGIIGIIAAITIHGLKTQIDKKIITYQLKVFYSKVNKALKFIQDSEEGMPSCYYSEIPENQSWAECRSFYNKLAQQLKIAQYCLNDAYNKGCIPKYKGLEEVRQEKYPDKEIDLTGCAGYSSNSISKKNTAYVLLDSSIIVTYQWMAPQFLVDVNGKNKPNKWGYDLFAFRILENKDGSINLTPTQSGDCFMPEQGGKWTKDALNGL